MSRPFCPLRKVHNTPRSAEMTMDPRSLARKLLALACVFLLVPGEALVWAAEDRQTAPAAKAGQQLAPKVAPQAAPSDAKLSKDELGPLVAPIALYPDTVLAQTLVASTYPLELIQLHQWLGKNKDLKGKALAEAVQKQDWDPSIQAMAVFPDLVK